MTRQSCPLVALLLATVAGPAAAQEPQLADKARAVLKTHCYRCHGQEGAVEGGLNYVADLAKLVSSLSWNSTVRVPVDVDPARTVLRVDLRWYQWDATTWNRVLVEYPYGVLDDTIAARAVSVNTAARLPVVRADWFVATAS